MKKAKYILCIILAAVFIFSTAAPAAALDADKFEARQVTAYLFGMEKTATLLCYFDPALPEVPYIDVLDYFSLTHSINYEFSSNDDGIYSLKSRNGEMIIDVENDRVTIYHFPFFTAGAADSGVSSDNNREFITLISLEIEEEKPLCLDLSAYNIDVIEKNGRVYFPVSVLNDIIIMSYISALYIDGSIYFTINITSTATYFSTQPIYDKLERSEALAEFTYNELCFQFDNFYGCPSKALIASKIDEFGFDKALDLYPEEVQLAKQLLKSTSLIDFHLGLCILSELFNDGGHTQTYMGSNEARSYDNEFKRIWDANFNSSYEEKWSSACTCYLLATWQKWPNYYNIMQTKQERLEQYDKVTEWEGIAALYICGDTAVFSFDNFFIDVLEPFKQSLDYAKELGIKNFVIDLSTNMGGLVKAAAYFIAMIINKNTKNALVRTKGAYQKNENVYTETQKADLNLDGKIDDLDNEVIYDFDFALLTTSITYSAACYLAEYAKENGVMLIGEKNGGGSCDLGRLYMPASGRMQISMLNKRFCSNGDDLEGKGEVDVDLRKPFTGSTNNYYIDKEPSAWGVYDYDDFYDLEALGRYINELYDKGDLDGDGTKSNKDLLTLFNYVSDNSEYIAAYDINSNGKINNRDVLALFRLINEV